jgi:hypothetical protein
MLYIYIYIYIYIPGGAKKVAITRELRALHSESVLFNLNFDISTKYYEQGYSI